MFGEEVCSKIMICIFGVAQCKELIITGHIRKVLFNTFELKQLVVSYKTVNSALTIGFDYYHNAFIATSAFEH